MPIVYNFSSGASVIFSTIFITAIRNDEGNVKLQIYSKPTHTDQDLNFSSHHPIEHKLSVVRTLLQRSQSVITDSHDRQLEDAHIEKALLSCGYPDWTFRKVKYQIRVKMTERKQKSEQKTRRPIVEGTSERVSRVMKKHQMPVTMRPVKTLKLLFHKFLKQIWQ